MPFQNIKGRENILKKILITLLVLTLTGAVAFTLYFRLRPAETSENPIIENVDEDIEIKDDSVVEENTSENYCLTCGQETAPENANLRPLAVIIENHPAARPQSGLEDACIVYEVVAEGGITRFLAIYTHKNCNNIGPVRSVRKYFAEIAKGYDAMLAHCGGSPTGYLAIKELHLADLDEFANSGAYRRVSSRKMPHNLYTSTKRLRERAEKKNFASNVSYESFKFKNDAPLEKRPEETYAIIDFSTPKFKVKYEYNRENNSYSRFMGGMQHKDSNSGKQLEAKNILVLITSIRVVDKIGRVDISTLGSGPAYAFLDGTVITGRWTRESLSNTIKFYDQSEKEIALNRGQTWIEIISPDKKVDFPEFQG
ncbi:DUF3048 domain-containing protein [Candidatus Oleimmundimicrobium sp.]|uniref:DUF3048 domain-containing protein n=1 Tax=Candidatus Oleimmundimicrobium sp. TaxID=3060597 RepID=UPI00271CAE0B|nr:DUF3048 domain-containing protein [Candidatus Oleimmundimicrobium sp.]MDO8885572.1 DUF3048 domain-containing protein [Candidatus Oleimmundimicrobium sp.]